jgi:hypothetical protein
MPVTMPHQPVSYPTGRECASHRSGTVGEAKPPDVPKPRLLDRVRHALRIRHYSRRTEEAYVAASATRPT